MITPKEIKYKANKKYKIYLQSLVKKDNLFPLVIQGNKEPGNSLTEFSNETTKLIKQSKDSVGFGYSIEFKNIKTKKLGTQNFPTKIFFETEEQYLQFLTKQQEVKKFKNIFPEILNNFPELTEWVESNPIKIIENFDNWDNIFKVCFYFKENPRPNLYIRELPIKVHTKFIENNRSIIKNLLDIIIKPFVNNSESSFEKRFNLQYRESLVRFKILDTNISNQYFSGESDMSLPLSQFQKLNLPIEIAIIVENKTTLYTTLTLPLKEKCIAIFGSGYKVSELKGVRFLNNIRILYWGDIDAQGFEILSQLRGYFPQTKSIFMDCMTFDYFFEDDRGTPSKVFKELNLTKDEKILYIKIKLKNYRLEQEKIPLDYIKSKLLKYK